MSFHGHFHGNYHGNHFRQRNYNHPSHSPLPGRDFIFRHVPARNKRENLLDEFHYNYNRTHTLLNILENWETDIRLLIAYGNGQQNAARYDRRRDLEGAVQRLSRLNVEFEDAIMALRRSRLEDILKRNRPRNRERRGSL